MSSPASAARSETISVIVPAFNREQTLAASLDSLLAQSDGGWQAIVVDDGSSDGTAAVAESYVARDARIELRRVANGGVSRARNAGIERAQGEWLFFLDADDWIVPDAFQRLRAAATADPEADAVLGACLRMDERGRELWTQHPERGRDLFPLFARTCAIVIHSCLVRTELIRRAGCFDDSLVTCEDWDLWQRISRLGARFTSIPETVAVYRMRANSASRKGRRMLEDGLVVIDRGHGEDVRLADSDSSVLPPAPAEARDLARTYFACYAAGLEIAAGVDPRPLIPLLGSGVSDNADPEGVAETLFNSVADGRAAPPSDWGSFPAELHDRCLDFLAALGARLGDRWHVSGALNAFQRLVLSRSQRRRPCQVGSWYLVELDAEGPPPQPLGLDAEVELVLCGLRCGPELIGDLEIPVIDGWLPARVLADAVVAPFAWDLLRAFFELHVYPQLRIEIEAGQTIVSRQGHTLFEGELNPLRTAPEGVHDQIGWGVFLQELWGERGMFGEEFYLDGDGAEGEPRLLGPGERLELDLAEPLPSLRMRRGGVIPVAVSVAGVPLTAVHCKAAKTSISAHLLRREILRQTGFELCRAVLREAVLLAPEGITGSLRERLQAVLAGRRSGADQPAWPLDRDASAIVIGRGAGPVGSAVSRWLVLPAAAREERLSLARAEGDPVLETGETGDPRLLSAPVGENGRSAGPTDDELLDSIGPQDGVPRRSRWPLRRRSQRRDRTAGTRSAKAVSRMPILMYHRVAADGPAATQRWRLHPEAFEEQLAYLRDNEFQTLTFAQWRAASDRRHRIPARSLMLTFDDGYADFPDYAMPLLAKYGFTATMFVVTDLVGSASVWDSDLGEPAELMGWEAVRAVSEQGIEIGSHSSRHRSLVALSPAELVRDLCASRVALRERLDLEVRSVCYPYGLHDARVLSLAGACGFHYGVTTNGWHASFGDDLLGLPRVEVQGEERLPEFARKLKV